ncbi:MAG: hypothetical protein QNJ33_17535, partial [Crocosphaera sp.]|nr:hypothetical protein [Crocosphaera sp.]
LLYRLFVLYQNYCPQFIPRQNVAFLSVFMAWGFLRKKLNADLSQRAIAYSDQFPWINSPSPGVQRRMFS